MAKDKKLDIISCPKCGRQYLPAEIYFPNEFFGRPKHIERDNQGQIMTFAGQTLNPDETFMCDCGTKFKVSAKINFITTEANKDNFDEDYKTSLKKEVLFMNED